MRLIIVASFAIFALSNAPQRIDASALVRLADRIPITSVQMLRAAHNECNKGQVVNKADCLAHAIYEFTMVDWRSISERKFEQLYEQIFVAPCEDIQRLSAEHSPEIDALARKPREDLKSGAEKVVADLHGFADKCRDFEQISDADVLAELKHIAH